MSRACADGRDPAMERAINDASTFASVMVPVSSTVIPLPVYKVGYGLGFISKDKKAQSSFKPEGGIKLITIKKTQEKKT
ncbi:uncharacterized protein LOC116842520 isoform X2 [Odontomachus brunneus]|uniref:uncharacterized protein LOC116842520 isoform X2 n=1 Tax=Odontomachus brunneus TaxID=486640 RepID=UPI0013F25E02|nr:uncharacterized protein LOC116842520 isoform X2 [Odontomachus brunneus]